jgi:hypothetical protein
MCMIKEMMGGKAMRLNNNWKEHIDDGRKAPMVATAVKDPDGECKLVGRVSATKETANTYILL